MVSYATDSNRAELRTALSTRVNEAMKTLSNHKAPCCDKDQFCDKMMVSTWTVLEIIVVEHCGLKKKEKNGTFTTAHFCVAFGHLYESCWSKALKEED